MDETTTRKLGRPPKDPSRKLVRTTLCLYESELARLERVPGHTRGDKIRLLLLTWEADQEFVRLSQEPNTSDDDSDGLWVM